MENRDTAVFRTRSAAGTILSTNTVVRNTYILLSMTLLFSAAMAGLAMVLNVPSLGLLTLLGYFGLLFLVSATRNSSFGIVAVFLLTGFMGFTLGPMLNLYIHNFANGAELVTTALGGTGVIFLGLSGYALTTQKDFSYLAGFLAAGMIVLLVCILISIFYPMPMLQLAMSAAFMLFSAGVILFETSQIIHGGERNYIMATVSLYVALYNMFISLLHLLTYFAGSRD